MPDYDNTNRGALFQNEKAKETQPDYKGSLDVNGTQYWISGWEKLSKAGKPFLSLSIQPKEATKPQKNDEPENYDDITNEDLLNSIPF